jgi:hypothetical protein
LNQTTRPPRLSIVATSRNDDHGGNLVARMQLFVNGLAEQAERFDLPVELILVDWNPPVDRPSLADALQWRPTDRFHPVVVSVPPSVHNAVPNADRVRLFQMIAKNVGIRRARAPFVLATNIDILVSDELFMFMGNGLELNAMYRVDRHDVQAQLDSPTLPSPAVCRALPSIREHRLDGLRYPNGPLATQETRPPRRPPRQPIEQLSRLTMAAWDRLVLPKLHTSACGDFTLTSRDVWSAMRGYPEWPIFSWHIDGVVLYQAFAAGVKMVNLPPPMVAFHLEHQEGSGWTPEGSRQLFDRLESAHIPFLSTPRYRKIVRKIVRSRRGFEPFNGDDWGLASVELPLQVPRDRAGERT